MMSFVFVGTGMAWENESPDPIVKKVANTFYRLTHTWRIRKSSPVTELILAPGQTYQIPYTIELNHDQIQSDWGVSGYAAVFNRLPEPVLLNSIDDIISPGGFTPGLQCHWGGSSVLLSPPLTIPANWTLQCDYYRSLPNGEDRINHASANLTLPDGSNLDIWGSAPIDFSQATVIHVDDCVVVEDTYGGVLGTVCGEGATFGYSRAISYEVCGEYVVPNTTSFTTNDTSTTGSSSWNISVWVPCGGCTLTPGYWKTHSIFGPAPYDDTWSLVGESTPFFTSGMSYYEVLWTPAGGNAYYILARAYIAAELNQLNGASIGGGVSAAFSNAETLFNDYTPEAVKDLDKKDPVRAEFIQLATILDDFNNGFTGPGHCSE
jgi:hypothetical protein